MICGVMKQLFKANTSSFFNSFIQLMMSSTECSLMSKLATATNVRFDHCLPCLKSFVTASLQTPSTPPYGASNRESSYKLIAVALSVGSIDSKRFPNCTQVLGISIVILVSSILNVSQAPPISSLGFPSKIFSKRLASCSSVQSCFSSSKTLKI